MQPPPFRVVVVDQSPDRVRLRAFGDVDLATADGLADVLIGALHAGPGALVVELDLSGVGFLDARGVAVLVQAGLVARARGGVLRLDRPRRPVRRVLDLTGIAAVCELQPN